MSQDDSTTKRSRRASSPAASEAAEQEPRPQELAGEELEAAVREAGVEGRSTMTADEKREALAEAQGVEPDPVPEGGEGQFAKRYLIENAHTLLEVPSWVAAGALNSQSDTLTVEQARAAVQNFLDAPVEG